MNVEINTQKFNSLMKNFSNAIDNEDIAVVKELYPKLVEMTRADSIVRKLINIDMQVIETDD